MAEHLADISVIIPLGPDDNADALLQQFEGTDVEIIISSEESRARSLNIGAAKATRKFLWFLHADSVLQVDALEALNQSLQQHPDRLHYFGLKFDNGGIMKLNAWGANMRSKFFGVPFGDQGLCMRKDLFFSKGVYPEDVPYGEDHIMVWCTRRHGMKLARVPAIITTSARAYDGQWLGLTLKRQFLWIKQSIPEFWSLIRGL